MFAVFSRKYHHDITLVFNGTTLILGMGVVVSVGMGGGGGGRLSQHTDQELH